MPEWIEPLWITLRPWIPLMTITGIFTLVGSTLAIPWLILKMPADYFVRRHKPHVHRGLLGWTVFLLRNLLATILIIVGIIMLVLPGQGLLTILIGIMVSTYAGKYRMERAIMRMPAVYRSVNWVRRRYNRPPILYPKPRRVAE